MTRRDWLVSKGLAKPGRGKFSNAAKEALAKAEAEGITFDDGPSTSTAPAATDATAPVVKADPRDSSYLLPDDYRFPEAEYTAYSVKDGKKVIVSLRECCNTCKVSLVNHACNAPTIHNNVPVTIQAVA